MVRCCSSSPCVLSLWMPLGERCSMIMRWWTRAWRIARFVVRSLVASLEFETDTTRPHQSRLVDDAVPTYAVRVSERV